MTRPAKSYVYVIGSINGPYKIGKANSVKDRLSSIQTGSHVEMLVHHSVEVPQEIAIKIEKRAHGNLGYSRIKGEWFDVGLKMAVAAVAESTSHFLSMAAEVAPEPKDVEPSPEPEQQAHFDVSGVSFVKRLSLREYAEIQAAKPLTFPQRMAEARRKKSLQKSKLSLDEAASVTALNAWLYAGGVKPS